MKDESINKITYGTIAVISLICIVFSVIIYVENMQLSAHKQDFCSAITGSNGCQTVQTSDYSKTLGISNTWYGIIGFLSLGIFSLLAIKKSNKIMTYLTIAGGVTAGTIAIFFIYLQTFVIHAYCIFCMVVDIFSIILLGLSVYLLIHRYKNSAIHK